MDSRIRLAIGPHVLDPDHLILPSFIFQITQHLEIRRRHRGRRTRPSRIGCPAGRLASAGGCPRRATCRSTAASPCRAASATSCSATGVPSKCTPSAATAGGGPCDCNTSKCAVRRRFPSHMHIVRARRPCAQAEGRPGGPQLLCQPVCQHICCHGDHVPWITHQRRDAARRAPAP